MQSILHQVLQGLQQIIAWFFRLVETIWGWSLGQIDRLAHLPQASLVGWQKLLWFVAMAFLLGSLIAVVYYFRGALKALWNAFAMLLTALAGAVFYVLAAGAVSYAVLFILNIK